MFIVGVITLMMCNVSSKIDGRKPMWVIDLQVKAGFWYEYEVGVAYLDWICAACMEVGTYMKRELPNYQE